MTDELTTGQKIRAMMAVRNIKTQVALAKGIGVNDSIVSLICNDKVAPTSSQLKTIKKFLRWPPGEEAEAAFAILVGDEKSRC